MSYSNSWDKRIQRAARDALIYDCMREFDRIQQRERLRKRASMARLTAAYAAWLERKAEDAV